MKSALLSKLSLGVIILVLIVILLIIYFFIGSAVIHISPVSKSTQQQFTLLIEDKKSDTLAQLPGTVWETEITLTDQFPVGDPTEEVIGKAHGDITIVNNHTADQTLIATTRFLTPNNILFRLDRTVVVPRGGSITATITADTEGPENDIHQQVRLIIPGLREPLQEKIYGEVTVPLTGGITKRGTVQSSDIEHAVQTLTQRIDQEAQKQFLATTLSDARGILRLTLPDVYTLVRVTNEQINVPPDELTEYFTATLTAVVKGVAVDSGQLIQTTQAQFIAQLPEGEEFISLDPALLSVTLEDVNTTNNTATISVHASADTLITPESTIINPDDLTGLASKEAEKRLRIIPGVETVAIELSPFWLKRLPRIARNITIDIKDIR